MAKIDAEYPAPLIREQRRVVVNGFAEIWTLKWRSRPQPECAPEQLSLTCPCMGFAYGESGDLDLIRTRNRVLLDQLHITPLFHESDTGMPGAILQRREPDYDRDFDESDRPDFEAAVMGRPVARIMNFEDYNHDGQSAEFYLQTETEPCGKSAGVVIGVSKDNPSLHVFGTASDPGHPLGMQKFEWEALAKAAGAIRLTDWACADHGAEQTVEMDLSWRAAGIEGSRTTYSCTADDKPDRLISREPL